MPDPAPSVDARDIAQFARLGEQWWDLQGPMKALHRFNPVRVGWIRDLACARLPGAGLLGDTGEIKPLAGLRVLDVGCGGGILCEPLARLGATVTGIDPAPGNAGVAGAHAQKAGLDIDYRETSLEALVAVGERFDVVLAMEVVEHVVDRPAFVRAAGTAVADGGLLFVATLNRTLKSYALAILGAEFVLRWVPRGTHDWRRFVSPGELRADLRGAGFREVARSGVVYNPLTGRWGRSDDTDVNYMIAAARAPLTHP